MSHRVVLYKTAPHTHSKEETLEAWEAGKDFKIVGGPYCSIRNLEALKKDYDIIELKWLDNNLKQHHHAIHIHILAGITHYI